MNGETLWQLMSAGGRRTESRLATTEHGEHLLTVLFNGEVEVREAYTTPEPARSRAEEIRRGLLDRGWEEVVASALRGSGS
jgi:hypothetical protein